MLDYEGSLKCEDISVIPSYGKIAVTNCPHHNTIYSIVYCSSYAVHRSKISPSLSKKSNLGMPGCFILIGLDV